MSGLYFLGTEDFSIKQTKEGNRMLCNNIQGLSFIFFYSTQCIHCQRIIPQFKQLQQLLTGCQYGLVNVSTCRPLIQMASNTILPITYVPFIVLYINGFPYMVYEGAPDVREMITFIKSISEKLSQQNTMKQYSGKKEIPAYTTGIPLCGEDERHYLHVSMDYASSLRR